MGLEAFTGNNFEQLINWISSDDLNYLWGGPTYSYPLTYEKIAFYCSQSEVTPFIFKVAGKNAGFIALFRVSDAHYRICRVFIANEFRGQDFSTKMVESVVRCFSIKLSFGFDEWGRLPNVAEMDGKEYSLSIIGKGVNK